MLLVCYMSDIKVDRMCFETKALSSRYGKATKADLKVFGGCDGYWRDSLQQIDSETNIW